MPRFEFTAERFDVLIALIDQHLRRTGAGLLGRSGAVGDDLRVPGQFAHASRKSGQRDGHRARNVLRLEVAGAAHVDDERLARIDAALRVGHRDARHIRERELTRLGAGARWAGAAHLSSGHRVRDGAG